MAPDPSTCGDTNRSGRVRAQYTALEQGGQDPSHHGLHTTTAPNGMAICAEEDPESPLQMPHPSQHTTGSCIAQHHPILKNFWNTRNPELKAPVQNILHTVPGSMTVKIKSKPSTNNSRHAFNPQPSFSLMSLNVSMDERGLPAAALLMATHVFPEPDNN
ncbi:hypothetical protein AAFF_G00053020 [Aldrovandia affinis]|uniref:Uncharacterized protein n=1 Tax=Aldrovandia affinis TaxID=143900 RepID=A0AAD7WZ06_9TELE|nr:hypothetical protein AAFF_G00053020 [Aldrovandia affinis]